MVSPPPNVTMEAIKRVDGLFWLDLSVSEIEPTENQPTETLQSVTDRLVLNDFSVAAFVRCGGPTVHLALATK